MKILIVDDENQRHFGFKEKYLPENEVINAFTVKEAIAFIQNTKFDLIHLDHDLQDFEHFDNGRKPIERTGMDICRYLINNNYMGRIIIHSWNTPASIKMKKMFEEVGIPVVYEPYSSSTTLNNS